jgi:DNA recombination-dependent growth factor C
MPDKMPADAFPTYPPVRKLLDVELNALKNDLVTVEFGRAFLVDRIKAHISKADKWVLVDTLIESASAEQLWDLYQFVLRSQQ